MDIDELVLENSIEVRSKEYIHNLKEWDDGKIATINGWGNFSSFEITEKDKIKIMPLVKFPGSKIDGYINTYPELKIMFASVYDAVLYFSDAASKINRTIIPIHSSQLEACEPYILDKKNKIFLIPYKSFDSNKAYDHLVYDFKMDKVLYDPIKDDTSDFKRNPIVYSFENGLFLCRKRDERNEQIISDNICLYDFNKDIYFTNGLTNILSLAKADDIFRYKDMLIINSKEGNCRSYSVSWKENFEEAKITPLLSPLINYKSLKAWIASISYDDMWCVGTVGYYKGFSGELLKKYFFASLDRKSPIYGIPVVTTDFYSDSPDGQFLKHPVYGACYVEPVSINGKEFVRLYKMSDVKKIVQEFLLRKAKKIVRD